MAEGVGDRKRKGPLSLDWEFLLPSGNPDNDEPPLLQVVPEAEIRKPCLVVMDDEDDAAHKERALRHMPISELNDSIKRMRSSLKHLSLPDGGLKLIARLKLHEAELERRKRQEDNVTCKKVTSSDDDLTCIGVNDGTSTRTSFSVSAPQSAFALHLCSKLDNQSDHGATTSFREEISILNCCNSQSLTTNRQNNFHRNQKKGSASRKRPFESPIHFSVKNAKQVRWNGEQLGRHSSLTSRGHSEEGINSCFPKKENASCYGPSRATKRDRRRTVLLVDEEELEDDAVDQSDHVDQSIKEMRIYFPSRDDPEAIEICYSDLQCLNPGSYLSSIIMNFYIRYLQKPTSPTAMPRCDYHFFNTYFYNKLKGDVLNKIDKRTLFVKFRRWWKGVNIFSKAYIFLPIYENLHWSLVIICIPDKEDESGPIILHLDSLGVHDSASIFNDVKSFLIGEWEFLRQGEGQPELTITDKIWKNLSRRIDEKVIEVPQQRNEYDCGLFVLFFMERFIDEAPDRLKKRDLAMFGSQWFRPQEASSLRLKISGLLKQEFKNENEANRTLDP